MKHRFLLVAAPLALVALAGLVVLSGSRSATVQAQTTEPVDLFTGCNNVALTWPTGTATTVVAASIQPADQIRAIWRYNNAAQSFQGFSPQFPQASDLQTVNLFDPVFICMNAPGVMTRPVVEPGQAPTPVSSTTATTTVTPLPTSAITPVPTASASATAAPTASATAAPTASATAAPSATATMMSVMAR
jgi:hypothetical protein